MFAPREWRDRTSPVDSKRLADALTDYIQRVWLQHFVIDGAAINAFLFSALASSMDLYRLGAFGPTDWSYALRSFGFRWHPFWNKIAGVSLSVIVFPFLKWIMLPAIAAGLMSAGYVTAAGVTIGLWIIFMLYGLVTLRGRRRTRKEVSKTIGAMRAAWESSCGAVINPSRVRELLIEAERKGATYPPVLHTLIDRAIERDPTALLTRTMPVSV